MPPMRPPRICPTRPRIPPMRPPRSLPLPLPVVMSRSFSGADSVPVAPARDLSHAPSGVATTTLHRCVAQNGGDQIPAGTALAEEEGPGAVRRRAAHYVATAHELHKGVWHDQR